MDTLSELAHPNCPHCLTRCYLSRGLFFCDDCGARVVPGALVGLTLASGIALVLGAGTATAAFTTPAALLSLGLATWAAVRSRAPLPGALPFQLAMAAALVMAIGLAVGLE